MEAEEFAYYFEHHEFMPESMKAAKDVVQDATIERPARKISMIDGYAEEKAAREKAEQEKSEQEKSDDAPQEPKE